MIAHKAGQGRVFALFDLNDPTMSQNLFRLDHFVNRKRCLTKEMRYDLIGLEAIKKNEVLLPISMESSIPHPRCRIHRALRAVGYHSFHEIPLSWHIWGFRL